MTEQFKIETETFNGPLEVLLDLVEKRKLFVSDVSLATVADDYIHYVENHPNLPVAETAQFLVIASTLVLIKSRSLLPSMKITEEEDADIKELERRLKMYKKIRDVSEVLRERIGMHTMHAPKKAPILQTLFVPSEDMTLSRIVESVQNMIKEFPAFVRIPRVNIEKVKSLPEMIKTLTVRIKSEMRTRFSKIADTGNKAETIVSFLALLELVRGGIVNVAQSAQFEDIDIETQDISTPRY